MLTIKERIEILCDGKGIGSISALEKELGFGSGTILKWDRQTPSADKLAKVADYFGCSVDYLLGREVDDTYRDALAEELARDPDLRSLMDMSRKCTSDELNILKGLIKSWKK